MSPPIVSAIDLFLAEQSIAVVGVSRTRGFGNAAARALRAAGYTVFPVNEAADEIHGERCYRRLASVPEPVGAVLVVVPPMRAAEVVEECAALGIRKIWLQQGSESPEAQAIAALAKMDCVYGQCILMYARPRGVHRLHRWLHDQRERHDRRAHAAPR